MTREEKATRIIDWMLVLFELADEDYDVVDDALDQVARCANRNPSFPVTLSLRRKLESRGLLCEHRRECRGREGGK